MANDKKIKSDSKLIQFCFEILNDYLEEDAKFIPDINSSAEKRYHLIPVSGNRNALQNAHGLSVPVVKLLNDFFLSCSVSFKSKGGNVIFKSISLQFFDIYKLLFRAEWDNWEIKKEEKSEDEDIKQHPQPHWHLGESCKEGITEEVAGTFQEYIQNSNYEQFEAKIRERDKRDLTKLHFFMKMEEGKTQPEYYDLTYEANFKEWLRETMRSVNAELSYLSK